MAITTEHHADWQGPGCAVGRTIVWFCPKRVPRWLTGAGGSHNICATMHVSQDQIAFRRTLRQLAVIGDMTRLRLLRLLQGRELCVCELVDTLRMPQYAVSRHLRALRMLGLVAVRRDGRWMHYRLGNEITGRRPAAELLAVLCRHLKNERVSRQDDVNLRRRLALGRTGRCVTVARKRIPAKKLG